MSTLFPPQMAPEVENLMAAGRSSRSQPPCDRTSRTHRGECCQTVATDRPAKCWTVHRRSAADDFRPFRDADERTRTSTGLPRHGPEPDGPGKAWSARVRNVRFLGGARRRRAHLAERPFPNCCHGMSAPTGHRVACCSQGHAGVSRRSAGSREASRMTKEKPAERWPTLLLSLKKGGHEIDGPASSEERGHLQQQQGGM